MELIDVTKKLTNYFLNRLPKDKVCYWDLCFTEGNEERDSSAAAIAACGMMEMVKHLMECFYMQYMENHKKMG